MTISIITCTYNPDDRLLGRLLSAIDSQILPKEATIEYIIVDNNSSNSVAERDYIKAFLQKNDWAKVVVEKEAGLVAARFRGMKESNGQWLVFFDDDNEPNNIYLNEVIQFIYDHPSIGVFGPGVINVEYVGTPETIVSDRYSHYFQQKKTEEVIFSTSIHQHKHYPYGTGQVVHRTIMKGYFNLYRDGQIKTTDRKGNSLASAGDVQIIWLALKNGYQVATTPKLQIQHLINEKKATFNYLKRLVFGMNVSYIPAFVEIFPSDIRHQESIKNVVLSDLRLLKSYIKILWTKKPDDTLNFISALAFRKGEATVFNGKVSAITRFFIKKYKL